MVEDHRPIAPTNEPNLCDRFRREHVGFFQKSCHVRVALTDVMLSCSQVAINETQTRIVNHESRNDATLKKNGVSPYHDVTHSQNTRCKEKPTLFPYRPPIPRLMVAIAASFREALSAFLTNTHVNNPTKLSV